MLSSTITRRQAMSAFAAAAVPGRAFSIATFHADVTPPLGAPLFNAVIACSIADPLEAHGVVLYGSGAPIVLAAIDWCEIRNESYELWCATLAKAAGTTRDRVILSCVHQHDAPYSDIKAQRLLETNGVPQPLCNPAYDRQALDRVAAALRQAAKARRRITHVGAGQGKVDQVASNRRYVQPDGRVSWGRTSATRDAAMRALPEGLIDPWLKTISFWDGATPVAALSCYSTHPMTYYGQGDVSCDFPGLARARRQKETPGVAQIYFTGCSGDTIAGKYNDGSPENRAILAGRIHDGMRAAWKATARHRLERIGFRSVPMKLAARKGPGFELEDFRRTLADPKRPRLDRFEAALGLSWRSRLDSGHTIAVPSVDFGPAQLLLLPAEAFVQYQLWAQQERPGSLVMTPGFGECAPGYIPTARDAAEGYDDHYSWIEFPACEKTMRQAIHQALAPGDGLRPG